MIVHVVLFSPKPDLSEADRRALLDALSAAASGIPSIRRFRVGKRVKHGLPGYEQVMNSCGASPTSIRFRPTKTPIP